MALPFHEHDENAHQALFKRVSASLELKGDGEPPLHFCLGYSVKPGYLDISQDNGLLSREAFPQAFAQLEQWIDSGFTGWHETDGGWLAEAAANGGFCGKFSLGDGSTTFRLPYIPGSSKASVGFTDAAAGVRPGGFTPDEMRPITGTITPQAYDLGATGAFLSIYNPTPIHLGSSGYNSVSYILDSARLGAPYNGAVTHGPLLALRPLLKMYGTVTEASSANIAALIQATTAKLDAGVYAADKKLRPFASVMFTGTGAIESTKNIAAVVRRSVGAFQIIFETPAENLLYGVVGAESNFDAAPGISVVESVEVNSSTETPKTVDGCTLVTRSSEGRRDPCHLFAIFYN